jgi:Yip1 domain
MATIPSPIEVQQARISPFGRIIGTFFSPKPTFEDIARKPSWILPVILMTLFSLTVSVVMNRKVDWRDVASKRIEASKRSANMSPEQKEQGIAMSAKISPAISYTFGLIGPILVVVIVAAVMMLAYNVLKGAGVTFAASMAIVAHSYVVTIINSLLFILILFLKPPDTIDLENPVATNLGAFLPSTAPKALTSLGSSLDIFSLWTILLIGLGFAAYNPKKVKGNGLSVVLGVWAIYVVLKVGIAFITS